MALGKNNRIEGKHYSLKTKLKDGDEFLDVGYFEVQTRQGEEYKTLTDEELKELTGSDEPLRDVAGDLIRLDVRIGEFEKKPVRSFKLSLLDPIKHEVYHVDTGLGSSIGKGLANSVLNLKAFTNVQIGLYGQRNKETKKTYPAVALRQGDDSTTVKWKYDPKGEGSLMPPVRVFEGVGGVPTKDHTKQEEFLVERLKEFSKVVEEANKGKKNSSAPTQSLPKNEEPKSEVAENTTDLDEPPF